MELETATVVGRAVYEVLLGREPGQEEAAALAGHLAATDGLAEVMRDMLASAECRARFAANPAFRELVAPEPRPPGVPVIVFLHVPKTAGSALVAMLSSHFGTGQVCVAATLSEFRRQSLARLSSLRLLSGHLGPLPLQVLAGEDTLSVTLLREPLQVVPSLYGQLRRHGQAGHPPADLARELDFEAWVREERTRAWWSDFQARMLALPRVVPAWTTGRSFGDGEPPLDIAPGELAARAREMLERVGVAGVDGELVRVYRRVCALAGLEPRYETSPRVNTGERPAGLDPATREHLVEANRLDAELVARAAERIRVEGAQPR